MATSNLGLICASVRGCIDELNALLEVLEAAGDPQNNATRTAYRRLIRQLTTRQSELEERFQRLRAESPSMSEDITNEMEVAWSQLEKSTQVISRDFQERVGNVRGSLDSKRDK